ncbi:MAG TPA: hypothetical protein VII13_02330 [Vicinamibacteria bacterium]|jgi:hypothetical protein
MASRRKTSARRRPPKRKKAARTPRRRRADAVLMETGAATLNQALEQLDRAEAVLTGPTPQSLAALQAKLEAVLLEARAAIVGATEALRRSQARRAALAPARHK